MESPARPDAATALALFAQMRERALRFCAAEAPAFYGRMRESFAEKARAETDAQTQEKLRAIVARLGAGERAFVSVFLKHCADELARALSTDAPAPLVQEFAQTRSQLMIVEDNDVQRELRLSHFMHELQELCPDTLPSLTLRVCHLRGLEEVAVALNAFRPETFAVATVLGWEAFDGSQELTTTLLANLKGSDFLPLNVLYADLNKFLIEQGVMRQERYLVRRRNAPQPDPALWVKSDVMGSAGEDEGPDGQAAFDPARFMVEVSKLKDSGVGLAGGPGEAKAAGSVAAPGPSALALALDDAIAHDLGAAQGPASAAASVAAHGLDTVRRVAEEANASPMERATIEMVGRVFNYIDADEALPPGLKAQIDGLQLPIVRIALANPVLFVEPDHPARQVLDHMARLALYWDERNEPLVQRVRQIVAPLTRGSEEEFERAAATLGTFVSELAIAAESDLGDSIVKLAGEEERIEAEAEVDAYLAAAPWPDDVAPVILATLRGPWRQALVQRVLQRGNDPAAAAAGFGYTDLLFWSLQPKRDRSERDRLVQSLPRLVGALNAGFDEVKLDDGARNAFTQALMAHHTQLLRAGAAPLAPPLGPAPLPAADTPPVTVPAPASGPEAGTGSLPGARDPARQSGGSTVTHWNTDQLVAGDWFLLDQGERGDLKCKLSWISPKRSRFLFTSPDTHEAIAKTDEEVEDMLRRGALKLVDDTSIVQRAIRASFESNI